MVRTIRLLTLVGAALFAGAEFLTDLGTGFICYDMCPPESGLAAALGQRLASSASWMLPGALLLAGAWILCLVALARAGTWWAFLALVLALPASVCVAVAVVLAATDGKLLPTTWLERSAWSGAIANSAWSGAIANAALLLLLWPVAILLAPLTLRRREAGGVRGV